VADQRPRPHSHTYTNIAQGRVSEFINRDFQSLDIFLTATMTFSERKQSESECTLFAQADKEIQKEKKSRQNTFTSYSRPIPQYIYLHRF